jgi:hypothetical protein
MSWIEDVHRKVDADRRKRREQTAAKAYGSASGWASGAAERTGSSLRKAVGSASKWERIKRPKKPRLLKPAAVRKPRRMRTMQEVLF